VKQLHLIKGCQVVTRFQLSETLQPHIALDSTYLTVAMLKWSDADVAQRHAVLKGWHAKVTLTSEVSMKLMPFSTTAL